VARVHGWSRCRVLNMTSLAMTGYSNSARIVSIFSGVRKLNIL
jgi:hypothetical protein